MKHDPRIDSILDDCATVYGGPNVDDPILTADRNAWRKRAIELHKAARAYMQVADAILVRMRYRDDQAYDGAALELGDLLNDRQSAIGSALVAKNGPWNGHTPGCKANPTNVGHKLHECDCRLMPADQPPPGASDARYPSAIMVPVKPTQGMLYAMAELDGWQRGDRDHPQLKRWEDYWVAALSALPSATNKSGASK